MKRYRTKPVEITVFRLNGPEDIDGAIAHGKERGWDVAITERALIGTVDVTWQFGGGASFTMMVDPRFQSLAFDEDPNAGSPWFVINLTDLWSIYREIPS